MRKYRAGNKIGSEESSKASVNKISMLALDDDEMMTQTLRQYFVNRGYEVDTSNDPIEAIEKVREGHYDILLLDFMMEPINGDEVVARIRKFNTELFIVLLTGHKSMAPPIETVRDLDIQGYYEKNERYDQLEILVESCVKAIKLMGTIKSYRNGLSSILASNPRIYRLQMMEDLVTTIIEESGKIFGESDRFIYVFSDPDDVGQESDPLGEGELFIGAGKYEDGVSVARECAARLKAGESVQEIISGRHLDILSPLIDEKNEMVGVFAAEKSDSSEQTEFGLYRVFVRQLAAAVSNTMLHKEVSDKNAELEEAYKKLNDNYRDMIEAVRSMVDARDIYTRGHSDRVSHYSVLIAKQMGRDEEFVERIKIAGLFHDIGKISIPDNILLKNAKLTDLEYDTIKTHPSNGFDILSAISVFKDIADIIVQHHEKVDGTGYPKGIKGDEILDEAKILCVADSFDAMVSTRTYRAARELDAAVSELDRCSGTQFDPEVVDAFKEVLKDYDAIRQELEWTFTSAYEPSKE